MPALTNDLGWTNTGLRPARIVFGGDSTGQRNHSPLAPTMATLFAGEMMQAQALWPYFECDSWYDAADLVQINGCNRCRSGTDADQMLISEMITRGASAYCMITGVNDVQHGYTAAQGFAHIKASALQLAATGKPVFICNVRGLSTVGLHPVILAQNALLKAWTDTNPPGIFLIDLFSVYATGPTDPTPKAGFLPDGVHQEGKGATTAAPVFVAAFKKGLRAAGDARPQGTNLVSHPMFDGTGGTAGTGTSGSVGTHWYSQRSGSANTIVCSKAAGTDFQKVTVTGGSGAVSDGFFLNRNFGSTAIALTSGNWYQWSIDLDFDAWAGWQSCRFDCDLGSALYNAGTANDTMPAGAKHMTLIGAPVLATSNIANGTALLQVYFNGATAGSGTVTVSDARLAQVANPLPLHGM